MLKERGWIQEDPRHMMELTQVGMDRAAQVERNFLIADSFLEAILGVPREVAREDACKMEHLVSLETGRRLLGMMRFILSDPARAALLREAMVHFSASCDAEGACPLSDGVNDGPTCQDLCGRSTEEAADA